MLLGMIGAMGWSDLRTPPKSVTGPETTATTLPAAASTTTSVPTPPAPVVVVPVATPVPATVPIPAAPPVAQTRQSD